MPHQTQLVGLGQEHRTSNDFKCHLKGENVFVLRLGSGHCASHEQVERAGTSDHFPLGNAVHLDIVRDLRAIVVAFLRPDNPCRSQSVFAVLLLCCALAGAAPTEKGVSAHMYVMIKLSR